MQSRYMRPLVVLGATAALALPAAAVAKGHAGEHGKGAEHGQKAPKMRALNVRGEVTAVGDGTVDVLVKGANHHGKALRGQTVTVDVSDARIRVRDVNGDGVRDLADVAVGDRVLVQSRIAKGSQPDPAQPLVAKRMVDKGPRHVEAPSDDDSDDGSGDDGTGEEAPPAA